MKAFNKMKKPKHTTTPKWKITPNGAGIVQRKSKKRVIYLQLFEACGHLKRYGNRFILQLQFKEERKWKYMKITALLRGDAIVRFNNRDQRIKIEKLLQSRGRTFIGERAEKGFICKMNFSNEFSLRYISSEIKVLA